MVEDLGEVAVALHLVEGVEERSLVVGVEEAGHRQGEEVEGRTQAEVVEYYTRPFRNLPFLPYQGEHPFQGRWRTCSCCSLVVELVVRRSMG